MKFRIWAALAALSFVSPAAAQDANWTGFYAGVIVGAWSDDSSMYMPQIALKTFQFVSTSTGLSGGLEAGANMQVDNVVLGLAADAARLPHHGEQCNQPAFPNPIACNAGVTSLFTVRAKVGAPVGPALIYATGGPAVGLISSYVLPTNGASKAGFPNDSRYEVGIAAGVGAEMPLVDRVRGKAEYLYAWFPTFDAERNAVITARVSAAVHQLRVGVNVGF